LSQSLMDGSNYVCCALLPASRCISEVDLTESPPSEGTQFDLALILGIVFSGCTVLIAIVGLYYQRRQSKAPVEDQKTIELESSPDRYQIVNPVYESASK